MSNQAPPLQLLNAPLRVPVEQLISERLGRAWQVRQVQDLRDYACHPAAILSDGSYPVFVKFSDAANGLEQFEIELAGLDRLARLAGVHTPTTLGSFAVEGGALFITEAVRAVEREPRHWRAIGRTLAQIHRVKGERCGLETQGYFGPLYQDNRPMSDWAAFFAERRLWPRLIGAVDSGNLPASVIRQVEKLIARVPELCGPETEPCLLHGDAQQNNFITTETAVFVIDPAVYYGSPEFDLAFMNYFQPVPEEVFLGYQEELPIPLGFRERRDLWRVYGYLAAVAVEGPVHLRKLLGAVQSYL